MSFRFRVQFCPFFVSLLVLFLFLLDHWVEYWISNGLKCNVIIECLPDGYWLLFALFLFYTCFGIYFFVVFTLFLLSFTRLLLSLIIVEKTSNAHFHFPHRENVLQSNCCAHFFKIFWLICLSIAVSIPVFSIEYFCHICG